MIVTIDIGKVLTALCVITIVGGLGAITLAATGVGLGLQHDQAGLNDFRWAFVGASCCLVGCLIGATIGPKCP